ncbi:MAG: DUF4433 domain-containing protein [Chloroflexi bacterium]|nr:DUF4433 domain-containing protein [Chloroflexota bacterium]
MSLPPPHPKVYHITHIKNLPSIVADGCLWSERIIANRGGPNETIGMSVIKKRRLTLPVGPNSDTFVGDYVPFYFCPRSVMLYLIHRGNHPDLSFRDGQSEIVHLEADLYSVVDWAKNANRPWAFSRSNAGAYYARFESSLAHLDQLDWAAIANTDFRDADVKEAKQAEFLVHEAFPWSLVARIGVISQPVQVAAARAIQAASHKPPIAVMPDWYY